MKRARRTMILAASSKLNTPAMHAAAFRALGMDWSDGFTVDDLITGEQFQWGEHDYVRLDPHHQPAHVLHVRRL